MNRFVLTSIITTMLAIAAMAADRENQGVFGADPTSIAYDAVHDVVFTTAQCALSCFKSTDSGHTWSAAFPEDSLVLPIAGTNDTVGYGGGALGVSSNAGVTLVQCQVTGVPVYSYVFSDDGGTTWKTLFNSVSFLTWLTARRTEFGIGSISTMVPTLVKTYAGKLFVVVKQYIFVSDDQGDSWSCSPFPDSSLAAAGRASADTELVVFDLTFFGATGDSFYVLGTGPNWQMKQFLTTPANYKYVKAIWKTVNAGDSFSLAFGGDNSQLLYEDLCSNPPGSTTFEPCTMSAFNFDHIECTPSGDTIFVQDGLNGTSIDFSPMMIGQKKCLVSKDGGLTWNMLFKESAGNNLGQIKLFCDPALPTGMRLFLGSSRFTDATDSAGTLGHFDHPDSIGYGEMNRTPASIDLMLPGAQTWIGLSDVGPFVSTRGIDAKFQMCIEGLEAVKIYDIAQLPDHLDTVFLATHMGLAATKAYTDTSVSYADKWQGSNGVFGLFNGETKMVAINPNNPALVVVSGMNGLRISNGTGSFFEDGRWTMARFGMIQGSNIQVYIVGLDFLKFNSDGGEITGIAFMGEDTILASFRVQRGTDYGGLMQSFDGGANWSVNTTVPDSSYNDVHVATDASGNRVIYLTSGKNGSNGFNGFFLRSTGDLNTWEHVTPVIRAMSNQPPMALTIPTIEEIEFAPGQTDTAYLIWDRYPAYTTTGMDTVIVLNNMVQSNSAGSAFTYITVNKNHHDSAFFAQGRFIWLCELAPIDTVKDSIMPPRVTAYFAGMPGEMIYDVLYDDLTMSSSNGFFAIQANVDPDQSTNSSEIIGLKKTGLPYSMKTKLNKNVLAIHYTIPEKGETSVAIYDLFGKQVAVLCNGLQIAGNHSVQVNRKMFANGVYVVRLKWKGKAISTALPLLK